MNNPKVEIKDKILLTIEEAGILSNIGINRMRELVDTHGGRFTVKVGANGGKILIHRQKFENFLMNVSSI